MKTHLTHLPWRAYLGTSNISASFQVLLPNPLCPPSWYLMPRLLVVCVLLTSPVSLAQKQLLYHHPCLPYDCAQLPLFLSLSRSLCRERLQNIFLPIFIYVLCTHLAENFIPLCFPLTPLGFSRESPRVERVLLNPSTVNTYCPASGPTWISYQFYHYLCFKLWNHQHWQDQQSINYHPIHFWPFFMVTAWNLSYTAT